MLNTNAFDYINVLDKAADASWMRNEVIANNIANTLFTFFSLCIFLFIIFCAVLCEKYVMECKVYIDFIN